MKINTIFIIIIITILFLFLRYLQLRFRLDKYHFKNNKKIEHYKLTLGTLGGGFMTTSGYLDSS